ncbi:MAG: hypothetical protein ACKVP7_25905 [Hyphomicrobiaceae bacterium]
MAFVNRMMVMGAMLVVGLTTSGCLRHATHEITVRTGSIKDEMVTEPAGTSPAASQPRVKKAVTKTAPPVTTPKTVAPPKTPAAGPAAAEILRAPPAVPAPSSAPPPAAAMAPSAPATTTLPATVTVTPPATTGTGRPPEAPDVQATEAQLEEGRALFAAGKVIEARKRFIAALNGPIPEALLALARSFDTFYLSQLARSDGAPDMNRALTLYERAAERGALEAPADLERIKATMGQKK